MATLVLDEMVLGFCWIAGEIWRAVSCRIVHARLKLASTGQRLPGILCRSSDVFVLVVYVYLVFLEIW